MFFGSVQNWGDSGHMTWHQACLTFIRLDLDLVFVWLDLHLTQMTQKDLNSCIFLDIKMLCFIFENMIDTNIVT